MLSTVWFLAAFDNLLVDKGLPGGVNAPVASSGTRNDFDLRLGLLKILALIFKA